MPLRIDFNAPFLPQYEAELLRTPHKLDLSGNLIAVYYTHLNMNPTEMFRTIPRHLLTLSLENNLLNQFRLEVLTEAFPHLPTGLLELDLSSNSLSKELIVIAPLFPPSLIMLNLSNIYLQLLSSEKVYQLINACSKNINHLNLASNTIAIRSFEGKENAARQASDLIEIFSGLSPELESLNLSNNSLGIYTPKELALIFASLPIGLKSLILNNNNFNFTAGQWASLIEALPNTLKIDLDNVSLQHEVVTLLKTKKEKTMKALIKVAKFSPGVDELIISFTMNYSFWNTKEIIDHQVSWGKEGTLSSQGATPH